MRTSLLALILLAVTTACATAPSGHQRRPASIVEHRVDTLVQVDTVEVEAGSMSELEARIARLQLQLLEREALIDDLHKSLDGQRQEVVRNMAKLQSQANRAEAASGMAEAELALQALAGVSGGSDSEEYTRGADLLSQADAAFRTENYGGALYLATEARTALALGQRRLREVSHGHMAAGESLFALPVPLATVTRSNVRSGPGLRQSVVATLEADTEVTGISYTNEWVRISYGDAEGWIFHTLVSHADSHR